jgi:ribosomal protein S15P/S13E
MAKDTEKVDEAKEEVSENKEVSAEESKNVAPAESTKEKEKKSKKLSQKAYEAKVIELADSGLTSEKIGQKLRDEGIHPNDYEGKISKILGEKYVNADLKNVEEKFSRIEKHYEGNKQDKRAKREKDRIFSQIRKLKKYFGVEIVKKRNVKKVRN